MIAHSQVLLYEDNAGGLYLAADDDASAWEVSGIDEPGTFEPAAIAILNCNADDWTTPRVPVADLDAPTTRVIARYDDTVGRVEVYRDEASGRVLAGLAGRRYIGDLDEG